MAANIKIGKFSRILLSSAFLKDVINEDGKICKSFYWMEQSTNKLKQLNRGEDFKIKYECEGI